MIKKHESNYKGMSKDLASDLQTDKYFDAKNIRILATDQKSSFAITNEAGNELVFSIPLPVFDFGNARISYTVGTNQKHLYYKTKTNVVPRCELEDVYVDVTGTPVALISGTQVIIGTKELRDSALIVTTDDSGFDCFWELTNLNDGEFDLNLLYMNNLELSKQNLIQLLFNYENSAIQKVYFVDGVNQLRSFNIRQSKSNGDSENLIDLSASSIDAVSTFDLSQASIESVVSGGFHTSGMIQYAYSLYILNGSQTTISPLSLLTSISKGDGLGGGDVNEALGKSIQVNIPNIDNNFTHVKLYSIKYTSLNENPEIKIVTDKQIDNYTSMDIVDDGSSLTSISLESFLFLGSDPIIPKHITTKDNRLFPINVTSGKFEIDLDTRAYSFSASPTPSCEVIENTYLDSNSNVAGDILAVSGPDFILKPTHDAINRDYDIYKYKEDGITLGATGKYIEVEITQSALTDEESSDLQFFKDRELYRLGIKFYNRRGQTSDPSWIMDIKAPEGNLKGNYSQLKVTLTSEFYVWLNNNDNFLSLEDKPIGYKILRADRTLSDQTIFAQGFINPMVANYVHNTKFTERTSRVRAVNSNDSDIIPSMTRMFETMSPFVKCKDYHCLAWAFASYSTFNQLSMSSSTEGFKAPSKKDWFAQNFQHNRLMQFFSPEVVFRDNKIDSSYKLKIVGLMEQDDVANWSTETNVFNAVNDHSTKFLNGITSLTPYVNPKTTLGSSGALSDLGFYGPTNGQDTHTTHQVYRSFNGEFAPSNSSKTIWDIYGSPEVTEKGADFKAYNNDFRLRYSNNLKTMRMDNWIDSDLVRANSARKPSGCNTIGSKCITFAEGNDEKSFPIELRKSIEKLHSFANPRKANGILATKGVLIAEFIKEDYLFYTGGIYGGMSFESKSNSSYIDIGEFTDINTDNVFIESPGDTFVNTFTFTKLVKDDVEIKSPDINIVSEIVSVRVETTVDLKNRNDLSLSPWDNRWQPKYNEYQKYKAVYSQQPTLVQSVGLGSKIKKIQGFDSRIMASKVKIPGEFIDSWTDFLENESMDLDGKYGPINAVVNLNDEIFCLQDTGVSMISINPRVQVPGSDGISLELGTGGVLHDYSYISTTSGCLNKWGVISSEKSFYFIDLINRGIMVFDGSKVGRLSDANGFHHELLNRLNFSDLKKDNPVLGTGVSLGYNSVNADVYFSFLQSTDSFTLGFNEKISSFVSFYDYIPSWYINKGSILISSNQANTSLWEHFKGNPGIFYGQSFRSSVTLHIAPSGNEIILNGASYKLEITKNDVEVPNKGLTGVRVYNDYQDSGEVSLVLRENVWKKFRNWKLNFPRQSKSRDRVRSAWGFAEFIFDNTDGNKMILHDITIFYTQH